MQECLFRSTLTVLVLLLGVAPACGTQTREDAAHPAAVLETVEVEFAVGENILAGTLYRPREQVSVPGVVVLGGSDRGPRGTRKTRLAGSLAEGGAAVLIYDSPGTGRSSGNALLQTRADRAAEAVAAADFLRTVEGIDPAQVGFCGGSEGARIALLAAAMDPETAFTMAVSGAFGMSMMDLSRYRIEAMGLRQGLDREDIDRAHALEELLYALVTGHDVVEWRLLAAKTARWPEEPWENLIGLVKRILEGLPEEEKTPVWDELRSILGSWMNEPWFSVAVVDRANLNRVLAMDADTFFMFLERGPLTAGDWYQTAEELELLSSVDCPVLGIWGEEDDFLPPHRSAAWLRDNLTRTGNRSVTVRILPGADHSLFRAGSTEYVPGYPRMLTDWLASTVGRP